MCDGCRQKDRENGYFIFCIRNGIILKEDAKNCPLFKGAKNTEQQVQPDNSPKMCEECGEYPADLPSKLCCGCDAYKEHLS